MFERQKKLGIVTEKAELSPVNPYIDEKSADGKGWPEADTIRPWDTLTDEEKRLFARMAEVYVDFLSHADHQIGRLLYHLEEIGELDNTMIVLVSDNGASGEGGPNGSVNENKNLRERDPRHRRGRRRPATWRSWAARQRVANYPTGWAWAFNTPFKMWKQLSNYEGGTADPMIVSWPKQITSTGLRRRYRARPSTWCRRLLPAGHRAAGRGQGLGAGFPLEGVSFDASPERRHRDDRQADPVLLDGGHPGDLEPGLESRRDLAGRPRRVGPATPPSAGSCSTRMKTLQMPRSVRSGTGETAGAPSSFRLLRSGQASPAPCRWRTANAQ